MTDYTKLIDEETWAYIERVNSFYPPDTVDYTIDQQRAVYNTMCRAFHDGHPDGITVHDASIPTPACDIPIRTYRKAEQAGALVLYFHGGGFILGGLDSHDDVCAEICDRTGFEVVSVDYRLAPEHLHPAAFEDALAAFEWATKTYRLPIVLCGDSAGGNLAAAVSHATRGHAKRPVGQVLIYPGLGGDRTSGSYVTHAQAPQLTMRDLEFYKHVRTGGVERTGDIALAPLADADFANLPPTVLITAECDPLCSDGEAYGSRVVEAGGRANWLEEQGLVHGYLRARHSVGRARSSFTRIVDAIGALGRQEWVW